MLVIVKLSPLTILRLVARYGRHCRKNKTVATSAAVNSSIKLLTLLVRPKSLQTNQKTQLSISNKTCRQNATKNRWRPRPHQSFTPRQSSYQARTYTRARRPYQKASSQTMPARRKKDLLLALLRKRLGAILRLARRKSALAVQMLKV